MARSQAQSDFELPAPAPEVMELPEAAQASARSTKIVLTFVWIVLGILTLLCMIGPHIPAGE